MTPDLTGLLVIGLIGLALIALALACRLGPARKPRPDVTLGFRDPYR
jgi:hypothetical protein